LTVTLSGSLSIQTYKEVGQGNKPFYRLMGAVILPAEVVREWAKTLYLATAETEMMEFLSALLEKAPVHAAANSQGQAAMPVSDLQRG
jgi:hypothetical protein